MSESGVHGGFAGNHAKFNALCRAFAAIRTTLSASSPERLLPGRYRQFVPIVPISTIHTIFPEASGT
jgi:hypothetical protein